MCGIAGIIGDLKPGEGAHCLAAMLQAIEHRGPDSFGSWITDRFAFGMCRLSIIDIEGGDQPIFADDGVGIVFNGEIYNYKTLRKGLEEKGIKFKTQSDTEVILHLYRLKGIKAVDELEGMFAIALIDPLKAKAFLIRDRVGIKPLYYGEVEGKIYFASELKSIIEIQPERFSLNKQAIYDYLSLRFVPSPHTVWEGLYKLEPGHFLEFDFETRSYDIDKYWDVVFHAGVGGSGANYLSQFENLFLQAVQKRLLSADVPVGILLSGGLDSSAVAAAAVELGHRNFHTFSIGFSDGNEFSELNYARKVAEHLDSNHHEIIISQDDFLGFFDDFPYYTDEPLADLASIPLYFVSKLARKEVKVVLSGEGADEILAGYNLDQMAKKILQLKLASRFPSAILSLIPKQSFQFLRTDKVSDFLKVTAPYISRTWEDEEKDRFWNTDTSNPSLNKIRSWFKHPSDSPLDQLLQAYFGQWLVEDLLMKADKMSMATSLELRVPFLDHKLVEWAAMLPDSWKVGNVAQGFTTKRILRKFASHRIPRDIIERPKQGFPVPACQWLEGDLQSWSDERIKNGKLGAILDIERLSEELSKKRISDPQRWAHCKWNILVLDAWMRRWQ